MAPTTLQFCSRTRGLSRVTPQFSARGIPAWQKPKVFITRDPRLNMEEMLRKEANNSKKYELKNEINGSEIKAAMKHTELYHASIFNTIRYNALSVKNRMKRLEIYAKGYYDLKYNNKNIDVLIYHTCCARWELSKLIRINNEKKKIYGTDTKLIRRIFQNYIK